MTFVMFRAKDDDVDRIQVVELEIQLDEIKEQYNNVIRNSNSKAQQKKMAFLERNLEQLTLVQKQVCLLSGGIANSTVPHMPGL